MAMRISRRWGVGPRSARAGSVGFALAALLVSARALAEPVQAPSLYLSCALPCGESYLRQELSYFDFVRDRFLADYVVVVVEQRNAAGGRRVVVRLVPSESLDSSGKAERSFSLPAGASPSDLRDELRRAILQLLYQALEATPHGSAFELSIKERTGAALSELPDPWDYWVVSPELQGTGEGGSNYYFIELTSALTLRRITDQWRHRIRGAYTRNLNGFELEDGSRLAADVESWLGRTLHVRSLGQHWAVGFLATGSGSQYENLAGHVHGGAALEYNIFPHRDNAEKQLRFVYQAGPWKNWYLEESASGDREELRPYHAFSTVIELNQPWGSIGWVAQANQFLDDPELFRLSTGGTVTLKLVEGLALNLLGQLSAIEDLINLRSRPITERELLLWTAQGSTNFSVDAELSLSYTFGSRHNTVVNPRFGRVDLDEE
jgi:hypothetical protein